MKQRVKIGIWLLTGLLFGLYLGYPAWADTPLEIPDKIKIMVLNGKKVKHHDTLPVSTGINQIVAQFQGEMGSSFDDDAEMGYSDVFVIKFEANTQPLKMVIPKIKRSRDLDMLNNTADIQILDAAGQTIPTEIAILEKEGVQILRDFEEEIHAFNETDSPAAVNSNPPVFNIRTSPATPSRPVTSTLNPAPEKQVTRTSEIDQSNVAEKMLMYWYNQADEETRNKFKLWINQ
ncbi:MAG: DUF2057 domain-containing protein [Desulfotignum sp.]